MVGKYNIEISSKKVKYCLTIQRNISIVRGDSGTGKTTLVKMILRSRRPESPYTLKCEKQCYAFTGDNFTEDVDLCKYKDSIIFIDEDVTFVSTHEFARIVKESDCYFVIITREKLENLPYSCKSVYKICSNTLIGQDVEIENDFHSLFGFSSKPHVNLDNSLSCIITEDTKAGYEFFKAIADRKGITCISAGGKDKVVSTYVNRVKTGIDTGILVIVDGAAFGPEYEVLRNTMRMFFNSVVYLPESFEYLILKSGLVFVKELNTVLTETYKYADSKLYFSWERYYTSVLIEASKGTDFEYFKSRLNNKYLIPENRLKIQKNIPDNLGIK